MHTNTTVALKPNFMSSLLLCALFLFICIFCHNSQKFKTFKIKISKDSLFILLVLFYIYYFLCSYQYCIKTYEF